MQSFFRRLIYFVIFSCLTQNVFAAIVWEDQFNLNGTYDTEKWVCLKLSGVAAGSTVYCDGSNLVITDNDSATNGWGVDLYSQPFSFPTEGYVNIKVKFKANSAISGTSNAIACAFYHGNECGSGYKTVACLKITQSEVQLLQSSSSGPQIDKYTLPVNIYSDYHVVRLYCKDNTLKLVGGETGNTVSLTSTSGNADTFDLFGPSGAYTGTYYIDYLTAETGSEMAVINGTVTSSGNPVIGARVELQENGVVISTTTATSSGYYIFNNVYPSTYTVVVSSTGYVTAAQTNQLVVSGSTTTINFSLVGNTTPPATVTDLSSVSSNTDSVTLIWTAPGDEGTYVNIVSGQYQLKYSTNAADGWSSANSVLISTSVTAGQKQNYSLALANANTYYLWLKTSDGSNNWSGLSNATTFYTFWTTATIFSSTSSWGATYNPRDPYSTAYHDSRAQSLYLASELIAAGISTGTITAIHLYCQQSPGRPNLANFRLRVKETSAVQSTSWDTTGWTLCYGPVSIIPTEGQWYRHTFSTNFTWDGVSNILIDISRDDTAYSSGGGMYVSTGVTNRTFAGYSDSGYTWPFDSMPGTVYSHVPCLKITYVPTQPGYITGKVTSTVDGSEIAGSLIEILREGEVKYSTKTDVNGNYSIRTIAPVVYDIRVSSLGYGTQTKTSISVVSESTTTANFDLMRDTIPPAAVNNLTAMSSAIDKVTLTWTAPGNDGTGGSITAGQYQVKYSTNSTDGWSSVNGILFSTNVVDSEQAGYIVSNLNGGTTYYFWLKTSDSAGNWSELSNSATSYVLSVYGYKVSTGTIGYISTEYNNARRLVRDSAGNLYLANYKYCTSAGATQIYVAKSADNGQTWRDMGDVPIQNVSGYNQYYPSLVIDSSDNIHCVWQGLDTTYGNYYQIKYSKFNGTSWSNWVNISPVSNYSQYTTAIDIDSNNNLHVVWSGYDSTYQSDYQVKYSSCNVQTGTWSNWINISPVTGCDQYYPTMVIDSENKLHVLWYGPVVAGDYYNQIQYSKKTNLGWSKGLSINSLSGQYQVSPPSVIVDKNNGLHVVYCSLIFASNAFYNLYYTSYTVGTGWNNSEMLYSTTAHYYNQEDSPSMVIDKNNNLYVLWSGLYDVNISTDYRIKYSSRSVSGWSPVNILSAIRSEDVTARWQNYNTNGGNLDFAWTYPTLGYVCFNRDTAIELSTGATYVPPVPDNTVPAVITDLVINKINGPNISLAWTSVGDDGNTGNIIDGGYCWQYSTNTVNEYSITVTTNISVGRREIYNMTGLSYATTYYFRIKTADEFPNWSELSNSATVYIEPFYGNMVSSDTNLSYAYFLAISTRNYSNARRLARDSHGNLYFAYVKRYWLTYSYETFVAKSVDNGQTWQDIGNAPIQTVYDNQYVPSLVVDSSDNVHCVWSGYSSSDNGIFQIKYSKYNGTSWSNWINIAPVTGFYQYNPSIDVDSDNNLHVVWWGRDSGYGGAYQIKYTKYSVQTGTWSNWVNIAPTSGYSQYGPVIAVDSDNNLNVAWYGPDTNSNGYDQIKYSRKTSSGWSSGVNVSTANQYQRYPSIVVDSYEGLHLTYYTPTSPYNILYTSYTAERGWNSTETIYNSASYPQYAPSIVVDRNDDLHVLWHGETDYTGQESSRVKYSYRNSSGWSNARNLTNEWSENVIIRWQNYWTNDNNLDFVWSYLTGNNTNPRLKYICYNKDAAIHISSGIGSICPNAPELSYDTNISTGHIRWILTDNADNERKLFVSSATNSAARLSNNLGPLTGTTVYWTETGLTPNKVCTRYAEAYRMRVSSYSTSITVCTLANPPTGSYVVNSSSRSVQIQWSANGNPSGTMYNVYQSTDNASFSLLTSTISLSYLDTNLLPLTTYYYKVQAYNANSVLTDFDTTIIRFTDISIPQSPINLLPSSIYLSSITWTWNDNSDNETGFRVCTSSDNGVVADLSPNVSSYNLINLLPNTSYSIYVEAYNWNGSSASLPAAAYTLANPATGTYFVNVDTNSVEVGWFANNNPAYTVYEIQYATDTNFVNYISTMTMNYEPFDYAQGRLLTINLSYEVRYYFKVRAYNANNVATDWSVTISTVTGGVMPLPPTGFKLSSVNVSSITWSWTDNSDNETGFWIRSSSDNSVVADLSANVSSYNHINLSPNTSYSMYVEAYNICGSTATSPIMVYTLANPATGSYFVNATTNSIETGWLANDNPLYTMYEIQYSTDINFVNVVSTTTNDLQVTTYYLQLTTYYYLSFVTYNLQPETLYWYKIRAFNQNNISTDWSIVISTETVGIPPDPPLNITAEALSGTRVYLKWDRSFSEDISLYKIYWVDDDPNNIDYEVCKASVTYPDSEYTAENLIPDKLYYFVVRAVDKKGNEEKNKFVVSAMVYEDKLPVNITKIVAPAIGKKIGGSYVTLMINVLNPQDVKAIEFQYKLSSSDTWTNIDIVTGYTVQWNITNLEGQYNVRAMVIDSLDQRYNRGYSTIVINKNDFDVSESKPEGADYQIVQRVNPLINNTIYLQNSNNKIVITSGTFLQPDRITVTVNPAHPLDNNNSLFVGSCWEINLTSAAVLLNPVTLQMSYRDDNNDGLIDGIGAKLKDMSVYSFSAGNSKWEKITCNFNHDNKTIEASVTHFSYYALYVELPANMDNVYCYPNPYKPFDSQHNFGIRFSGLPSATTRLRVFNIAGEMVYDSGEIEVNSNVLIWNPVQNSNGEDIASGLYIYMITNNAGEIRKGKFTIIR